MRLRTRSKFGSVMTTVDGVKFRSKREAKRFAELKLLEKAGEIQDLELQPSFDLNVVGGEVKDIVSTIGRAVMDFKYFDPRKGWVIEDCKGYDNPLSRWKRRHVEKQYGITVEIVK